MVLYSLGEIEIGANAVVSQRSHLCAASHDYTQPDFPIYAKKVCIGEQAWLATDVLVAPGVTVGEGAQTKGKCVREGLIKSEHNGSIHPKGARTSARHFPFVLSAALARCIEGANGKHCACGVGAISTSSRQASAPYSHGLPLAGTPRAVLFRPSLGLNHVQLNGKHCIAYEVPE